jgi:hypothetical protein
MYDRLSRSVAAIITAAMIMSAIPAIKAIAPPAPAIWITPDNLSFDTTHTNVGDNFNVTLNIATTGPSFTWQVRVNFNPSQINAVRADYTGSGKSQFFTGHGTIPVTPTIDNAAGFVVHGESMVGSDSVPAGTDTLLWIEFKIMAAPPQGETLTSLISVEDPAGGNTFILDPDLGTIPSLSVGSATYTYSPPPPVRDVTVTDLSFSNDHPKQSVDNVTITVVVLNNGTIPETFDVTIAFDSTTIATLNVAALAPGNSKTLTFEWNTSDAAVGKHTIIASATVVPFDTDPTNNLESKEIRIMSSTGPNTDTNGDGIVNMVDVAEAAKAFGSHEGNARWNPAADVNGDGVVNMIDLGLVARDFWKK